MDKETFLHVTKIARIALSEEEVKEFLRQFEEIERLTSEIKNIELGEECKDVTFNPLRDDSPSDSEDITSSFIKKRDEYLEVPKNL